MNDPQRRLQARLQRSLESLAKPPDSLLCECPQFIGMVYGNPTVPTTVDCFITVNPVEVAGMETEGAAPVFSVDGSRSLVVFLVGSKPVVAGDFVVCRFLGNRWVSERLGNTPAGITLPGCPCSVIPSPLTMTSSKPLSNSQIFQSATLVYGPPPSSLASLNLGTNCFLSTAQFKDASTNDQFWYYFGCSQGFYILTRVYATSTYSSPYRDQIRYRWLAGTVGNTCSPFLLSRGSIFSGGDASCVVTISA